MGNLFVYLVLLGIILFLLVVLSWVWPPDSPWAPWWRTGEREIRESLKLAKVTKKDVIYDLGSGNGRLLITAARECGARGVGIEIDPLRYFISKTLVRLNGVSDKVEIKRKSFFEENLSPATVVYMYLVPKTLEKLRPKLKKELKKNTRIISYIYEFEKKDNKRLNIDKKSEDEKIFIYRIK